MSSSKITLRGMYLYYDNMHGDLFEKLLLPEGISKNVVVDTILLNGGDYECLYGDPTFVHDSIENWSAKWEHTLARWANALSKDYEPLWNYDRRESDSRTPDLTNERTPDLTDTGTNDRSAFDSSGYQPNEKNTVTTTGSDTYTETGTEKWERWHRGNIGVMSSQDLLKQEIEVSVWSLYDSIARLFLTEYVIPIMV